METLKASERPLTPYSGISNSQTKDNQVKFIGKKTTQNFGHSKKSPNFASDFIARAH